MKRTWKVGSSLVITTILLGSVGCVDDEDKMKEPVQAKEEVGAEGTKDEFSVDKDGNVNFKAKIVYFEFDDHTLTDRGRKRLDALANHLKENPKKHLQIQGHCDERGSVEYNLALGEQRARSVKEYLQLAGVKEERLGLISYGEEKPAREGHTEKAYAKNRRANFVMTAAGNS